LTGTIINVGTVAAGSVLGTILGNRLKDRFRVTVMDGLGLSTVAIGLKMAFATSNILIVLGSIIMGGMIGEVLDIDSAINRLGARVEKMVVGNGLTVQGGKFSRGFVSASLLFCVGPMAIMGSIQDGLTGDFSTLAVKAALDGFAALAFSSTLGIGVGFSALMVLGYQGAITLGAGFFQGVLTQGMIAELTATGGILIFAIGLGLLELKRIRVANLLPAIFIAPAIQFLITLLKR